MLIARAHPLILPAVPAFEWREPSTAQRKDQFGNQNRTRFRIRLGAQKHSKCALWFDSRDDADFFLHSLVNWSLYDIPVPREDWRLPNEVWGDPELWPGLEFDFATVTFLTSTSASNQTWTVASDWNSASNTVTVIASGGSGGVRCGSTASSTQATASGGSGAGCSQQTNISLTGGASATYRLPAGGTGVTTAGGSSQIGNSGADAWFNGTTLGGSSVGAKAGTGGIANTSGASGASGGAAGSGVGAVKFSGGASGDANTGGGAAASGGGGAASPNSDGVASATTSSAGAGGAGGSPSGGSGASGSSGGTGSNGGDGTEFQVSPARGSGGGSGGARVVDGAATATSGSAGLYGAGTGGAATRNTTSVAGAPNSGNAGQALIVISYTPLGGGDFFALF